MIYSITKDGEEHASTILDFVCHMGIRRRMVFPESEAMKKKTCAGKNQQDGHLRLYDLKVVMPVTCQAPCVHIASCIHSCQFDPEDSALC
jgi:hypothetical protein